MNVGLSLSSVKNPLKLFFEVGAILEVLLLLMRCLRGVQLDRVCGLPGRVTLIPNWRSIKGVLDIDMLVSAVEALPQGPTDFNVVYRIQLLNQFLNLLFRRFLEVLKNRFIVPISFFRTKIIDREL